MVYHNYMKRVMIPKQIEADLRRLCNEMGGVSQELIVSAALDYFSQLDKDHRCHLVEQFWYNGMHNKVSESYVVSIIRRVFRFIKSLF